MRRNLCTMATETSAISQSASNGMRRQHTPKASQAKMSELNSSFVEVQPTRRRALIVPREHGAWGLLLVPLLTGVAAGFAPEHRVWQLLVFTLAALSLLCLRTPVESLLGTSSMSARTSAERRTAFIASAIAGSVACLCLIALMWKGRNLELLLFGAATACAFVAQVVLRKSGRWARLPAQLVGAIGLSGTAPAAYYLGTGHLDSRGLILWAANWLFAWNQIHFVQIRIHAARAVTFRDKFDRGKFFLLTQTLLSGALVAVTFWHLVPSMLILAFVPVLLRGAQWFVCRPEPLDVKKLGWSEMKQGAVFGVLLAIAFCSA